MARHFLLYLAFNNAGFTPHSDGIVPYGHDLFLLVPICIAVFLGSLGFPVFIAIQRNPFRPLTLAADRQTNCSDHPLLLRIWCVLLGYFRVE